MESVCRVCLKDKKEKNEIQFVSLFEGDESMSNKMMECAQVIVSHEDFLPKEICLPCADKLNIAYDFKVLCERSYHSLIDTIKEKSIFGQIEIKVEDAEPKMSVECKKETDDHRAGVIEYTNSSGTNCNVGEVMKAEETVKIEVRPKGRKMSSRKNSQGKKNHIDLISGLELDEFNNDDTMDDGGDDDDTLDIHMDVSLSELLLHRGTFTAANKNKGKKKKNSVRKRISDKNIKKSQLRLVCDQCGQTFTTRTSLLGHQRRHTGERLFVCSTCGKAFFVLNELKKHYNTHKDIKPYQCQYCERRFADWGSRLKHERCHRGERPYSCDVCTKTFSYSYVLSRHKLTHTGAKLFGCEKCKKNFSVKYQLNRHIRKDHKEQTDLENKAENTENITDVSLTTESRTKKSLSIVKKK